MALAGKFELHDADVLAALEAALEGIKARGKAQPGEKTMVDAWHPAIAALKTALDQGEALKAALEQATQAAEAGTKGTIPMLATKGRASYLGERSVGHQDPGATSTWLFFKAMKG
jgi:dihydroxyacetone kinase-like protein